MIIGWIDHDYLGWAIENKVSFFVFTLDRLRAALQQAKKMELSARIHLELETGIHRTGFCTDQLSEVFEILDNNKYHLKLEGLCTHYAGAEDYINYDWVRKQIKAFDRLCKLFEENRFSP